LVNFISVIIATHNRADYLKIALESLEAQSAESNTFEVIVVDNASTDNTCSVVESFKDRIKYISYIYETQALANHARNIGWQAAKGTYVAYIDDDAVPVTNWIKNIYNSLNSLTPKPGIIGGKVTPIWEGEKPAWLDPRLYGALSLIDYSDQAIFLKNKYPFSVNMVFQKDLLQKFGGFDLKLGRRGTKLLSGDETAIAKRIERAGYTIYYDPAICVEHHIHKSRLNQAWFIQRYYWGGYSDALMWRILEKPGAWQWLKKLSFTIYSFIRNPGNLYSLRERTNNPEKFRLKCLAHARLGFIKGMFDFGKD